MIYAESFHTLPLTMQWFYSLGVAMSSIVVLLCGAWVVSIVVRTSDKRKLKRQRRVLELIEKGGEREEIIRYLQRKGGEREEIITDLLKTKAELDARIRELEDRNQGHVVTLQTQTPILPLSKFMVGDSVRVIGGPNKDSTGYVLSLHPCTNRLNVRVHLFGSPPQYALIDENNLELV